MVHQEDVEEAVSGVDEVEVEEVMLVVEVYEEVGAAQLLQQPQQQQVDHHPSTG